MTSNTETFYEGALALPEEAREALALRILDSIETRSVSDVADAWRGEVVRRAQQVRRGEVETESWAEVEANVDRARSIACSLCFNHNTSIQCVSANAMAARLRV